MEKGKLIWITGLSGAGKTTIGKKVYEILKKKFNNCVFIDGDIIREMFDNDLNYDIGDRFKNAIRISKLCEFLTSQNIHVICATMSLFKEIHEMNRLKIKNYYEIFIDVEISELIRRDQKGLYSKVKNGDIENVIGVDLSYDKPSKPFLTIKNTNHDVSIEDKAKEILFNVGLI